MNEMDDVCECCFHTANFGGMYYRNVMCGLFEYDHFDGNG